MEFKIENMTCGGCAKSVTLAIQSVDPGAKVEANPLERAVKLETTASRAAIEQVLAEAGYPASAS
ncbi:MAG: heavy metal transport/detoxification protein [Pelagibacterium sp. SCN 63-23]|nr:MAG: heavy metal transport/detoxification protein [Pelagibacterium sp. SCN 63-23]